VPTARASSTAARNSGTEYWVVSSSSVGEAAPPEAMTLIWSAPRRSSSRTARRTWSTPSATLPSMPMHPSSGGPVSVRRR
jgi:hypothetical protein